MIQNKAQFILITTLVTLMIVASGCSAGARNSGGVATPTVTAADTESSPITSGDAASTSGSASGSGIASDSPAVGATVTEAPTATTAPVVVASASPVPVTSPAAVTPPANVVTPVSTPASVPPPVVAAIEELKSQQELLTAEIAKIEIDLKDFEKSEIEKIKEAVKKRKVYRSCKQILKANPKSEDGQYAIFLGKTKKITKVFCDMTTEGGGWTVLIDGANATRKDLEKYFENTSEKEISDDQFLRNKKKGIFWDADQYFVAKNMPKNSEIRLVFNLSYLDPKFGTNCYAILGLLSPHGYDPKDSKSFTAFAQKNDDSEYVKATYNDQEFAEKQSVQKNAMASYPHPFVNGSRVFAGNPYGKGNTCRTFFIKRLMVR